MLRNVGLQFASKATAAALAMIQALLIASWLPPAEVGKIAAFYIVLMVSEAFLEFGLNKALIQRSSIDSSHINTSYTIAVIKGALDHLSIFWQRIFPSFWVRPRFRRS